MILTDEPTGNLDTTSSHEIAEMLVELNESRRTIVLITHEEDIAAFAKRVVRAARRPHRPRHRPARPGGGGRMTLREALVMAMRGLRANRLRSLLTMLGMRWLATAGHRHRGRDQRGGGAGSRRAVERTDDELSR